MLVVLEKDFGRAGRIWTCDNPVSVVRLSGWAMPTIGGLLQHLRQLSLLADSEALPG